MCSVNDSLGYNIYTLYLNSMRVNKLIFLLHYFKVVSEIYIKRVGTGTVALEWQREKKRKKKGKKKL